MAPRVRRPVHFSGLMVTFIFAAPAFVFIPRTFLTLGVGGLYGLPVITMILIGVSSGLCAGILIVRYFLADHVLRWIDRHPSMRSIADAVDHEEWRIVATFVSHRRCRARYKHYVFGLTRIGFWRHALAWLVFTVPQTLRLATAFDPLRPGRKTLRKTIQFGGVRAVRL